MCIRDSPFSILGRDSPGFLEKCFELFKGLGFADNEHFTTGVFARFDELFQVASSELNGERIGDDLARVATAILRPCRVWQGDPDATIIHIEFDVNGVGMACRDGDYERLIDAMDLLFRPALNLSLIHISEPTRPY